MGVSKKVESYEEYLNKLKETFKDFDKMPLEPDIQSFISCYDLYDDWEIDSSDIQQDLRDIILMPELNLKSKDRKCITSYKHYLEKLRDRFGIPKEMPSTDLIVSFIDEYDLLRVWGISEEDVSKDLQSFIDGKYDEMYGRFLEIKTVVPIVPRQNANATSRGTYHTIQASVRSQEKNKVSISKPSKPEKSEATKPKQSARKTTSIKTKHEKQVTIFLDGDNHIKEGQKGIERLPENTRVMAIFSQKGAKRKFDNRYRGNSNVTSRLVKPGDQAVDNQIKAQVGQLLKKKNQDITIVSHDKGFVEFRDRKKKKQSGSSSLKVAKSVEAKYPRNKKK